MNADIAKGKGTGNSFIPDLPRTQYRSELSRLALLGSKSDAMTAPDGQGRNIISCIHQSFPLDAAECLNRRRGPSFSARPDGIFSLPGEQ